MPIAQWWVLVVNESLPKSWWLHWPLPSVFWSFSPSFPCWVPVQGILVIGFLSMCPTHRHFLLLMMSLTGSCCDLLHNSTLVTFSTHWMPSKSFLFLVFTQSQEAQKTIGLAAMLESKTKEIIKILLLRVHQHGSHDFRWKSAIGTPWKGLFLNKLSYCSLVSGHFLIGFS